MPMSNYDAWRTNAYGVMRDYLQGVEHFGSGSSGGELIEDAINWLGSQPDLSTQSSPLSVMQTYLAYLPGPDGTPKHQYSDVYRLTHAMGALAPQIGAAPPMAVTSAPREVGPDEAGYDDDPDQAGGGFGDTAEGYSEEGEEMDLDADHFGLDDYMDAGEQPSWNQAGTYSPGSYDPGDVPSVIQDPISFLTNWAPPAPPQTDVPSPLGPQPFEGLTLGTPPTPEEADFVDRLTSFLNVALGALPGVIAGGIPGAVIGGIMGFLKGDISPEGVAGMLDSMGVEPGTIDDINDWINDPDNGGPSLSDQFNGDEGVDGGGGDGGSGSASTIIPGGTGTGGGGTGGGSGMSGNFAELQAQAFGKGIDAMNTGIDAGIGAIQEGYNQGTGSINDALNRAGLLAGQHYNQGVGAINQNYGQAQSAINQFMNQGRTDLGQQHALGLNALNQAYDRGNQYLDTGYSNAINSVNRSLDTGIADVNRSINAGIANFDPYLQAGTDALGQQRAFMGLDGRAAQQAAYDNYLESPGQAFLREQGERAYLRGQSASGNLGSGTTAAGLHDRGIGLAAQNMSSFQDRLAALSGRGQQAAGSVGGLEQNRASMLGNLAQNRGSLLSGLESNRGVNLAGLEQNRGNQIGSMYQNLGANLSGLSQNQANALGSSYMNQGNQLAGMAQNQGGLLSNLELNRGSLLGNAAMNTGSNIGNMEQVRAQSIAELLGAQGAAHASGAIANQQAAAAQANADAMQQGQYIGAATQLIPALFNYFGDSSARTTGDGTGQWAGGMAQGGGIAGVLTPGVDQAPPPGTGPVFGWPPQYS